MMKLKQHTFGFTLVEIMVAIAVSSVLMLGVMQIFSSNKRANMIGGGLARVQENARFSMKKITQDMRMAGYSGCGGALTNHIDPDSPDFDDTLFGFDTPTGGWEYTNGNATSVTGPAASSDYTLPTSISAAPAGDANDWDDNGGDDLPDSLQTLAIPGSDVLVLKWAEDGGFNLTITNTTPKGNIGTSEKTGIPPGTILAITDCSGGDVFLKQNAANATALDKSANKSEPIYNKLPADSVWSRGYTNGATTLYFRSRAYYIGVGTSGEPALYRVTYATGLTNPVFDELAEGVESMQVLFGEDVNDDQVADRYVTADKVADHNNVTSLKIALLLRSPSEVKATNSGNNTYTLLGTDFIAPSDRRVRYVFNSTVKLRNRGKL